MAYRGRKPSKKLTAKQKREIAHRQARGSTLMEGYKVTPQTRKKAHEYMNSRKREASKK